MSITRNLRKWFGLLCAILMYFVIHEGAHLIYALYTGAFKQVNFMLLGVQIDIYSDRLTNIQLGIFSVVGAATTLIIGMILVILKDKILTSKSLLLKAIVYYTTLVLLLSDPLYLSVIYQFVGGGDMNGITLIIPELYAQVIFGIIGLLNIYIITKFFLPSYKKAYYTSVSQ